MQGQIRQGFINNLGGGCHLGHHDKCHNAECSYANCHFDECRGTDKYAVSHFGLPIHAVLGPALFFAFVVGDVRVAFCHASLR